MKKLQISYAKQEDIPLGYSDLYTRRATGGRFELTGIDGVIKSQLDYQQEYDSARDETYKARRTIEELKIRVMTLEAELRAPLPWWNVSAIIRRWLSQYLGRDISNPWSEIGWNVTEQGMYARKHGLDKAAEQAARAGSKIGATRPTPMPKAA